MSIPTLADHLRGAAIAVEVDGKRRVHTMDTRPTKPINGTRREHRIAKPEEDAELHPTPQRSTVFPPVQRVIQPTPTPEGGPMPTGVYPRKPKSEARVADVTDLAAKPKRKRAPKKPRQVVARAAPRAVGDASFVIDDRGRMLIRDGQQEISLERADVNRLTMFLQRTKAIRV